MMNVALLGYGQMGKIIESLGSTHQITIKEKYWDEHVLEVNETTRNLLSEVPVFIDFSIPDAALENIRKATELGKNIVVGTTGWHEHLSEVESMVQNSGIGLVYGSNFSLGVNLFYKMIDYASGLFSAFDNYDPYMVEGHHQFKKDAPSGTALVIQSIAEKNYQDKKVPISCIRSGYIPGTHSLTFDSKVDSIKLEHCARSREGFAEGAILAAKWIQNRKGFYAFQDVVEDILVKRK